MDLERARSLSFYTGKDCKIKKIKSPGHRVVAGISMNTHYNFVDSRIF